MELYPIRKMSRSRKHISPYRIPFLKLAQDGKRRTNEEIRDELALPPTININKFLIGLKSRLIIERANIKLCCASRKDRGMTREWWIEKKGGE